MDDYGLLVKNSIGNIQIDSTYRNLCFDRSVSGDGVWVLPVDLDKIYVLIPTTDGVSVEALTINNTTPCYRFYQSCTVLIYSYEQGAGVDLGEYGLHVFNSKREMVFNSNKVQFKILDYVYGSLFSRSNDIRDNYDTPLVSRGYDTQNIGVVLGQIPVGFAWHKFTTKYSGLCFLKNGNIIESRCRTFKQGRAGYQSDFNSYYNTDVFSYLVVDTTGVTY